MSKGDHQLCSRYVNPYIATEQLIRHAALLHDLVESAEGTQTSCPLVDAFADWSQLTGRGVLAFASDERTSTLSHVPKGFEAFDSHVEPRVTMKDAMAAMTAGFSPAHVHDEVHRRRPVGAASNGDPEARTLAALHFAQHGLPASANDIQVFSGGPHQVLNAFACTVMPPHVDASWVLAPTGYEMAWGAIPCAEGGTVVVDDLTEETLRDEWTSTSSDNEVLLIYLPQVDRLTGEVLTRERARGIARVVLEFNRERPDFPVYVLADNSGADTYHSIDTSAVAQSIGAISGEDLGDDGLGRMSDWTVTITTPGSDSAITFAVTANLSLRRGLRRWSNPWAFTATSVFDELCAAADLTITPRPWLRKRNETALRHFRLLRTELARINRNLGFDAVTATGRTAGGQYTAIQLHPRLFPMPSFERIKHLTQLSVGHPSTAAAALGALFNWCHEDIDNLDPRLVLRVNLGTDDEEFATFIRNLDHTAHVLVSATEHLFGPDLPLP